MVTFTRIVKNFISLSSPFLLRSCYNIPETSPQSRQWTSPSAPKVSSCSFQPVPLLIPGSHRYTFQKGFLEFYIAGIIQDVLFFFKKIWILWLGLIILRLSHVACVNSLFLYVVEQYSIVRIYHIWLSTHLLMDTRVVSVFGDHAWSC